MGVWRRIETIKWNDKVSKEEVLIRVKLKRNAFTYNPKEKAKLDGTYER